MFLDGMMGLIVGDALGCPVQFMRREAFRNREPVTGMEGYGAYNMPEGTWTDDGSMALATLDSIVNKGEIDYADIMENFVKWYYEGAYTQYGQAFDEGKTCMVGIMNYKYTGDWKNCGMTGVHANGNGALMRILPVCLYYISKGMHEGISDEEAIEGVHMASALTHNHLRSQMACGLYYFMAKAIVENSGNGLVACLQKGLDDGFAYYRRDLRNLAEMSNFGRMYNLEEMTQLPREDIRSSGYVIDSIEAAVWSLINTDTFADGLLKAVNLGGDTDTIAAIAGGLAGLYYGYDNIPQDWLDVIKDREYVEEMCQKATDMYI